MLAHRAAGDLKPFGSPPKRPVRGYEREGHSKREMLRIVDELGLA